MKEQIKMTSHPGKVTRHLARSKRNAFCPLSITHEREKTQMEDFKWKTNSTLATRPGDSEPPEPTEKPKRRFKRTNQECFYMKVTNDEFELPLVIADSVVELAARTGTTPNTISSSIFHAKERGSRCVYVKVPIADIEED